MDAWQALPALRQLLAGYYALHATILRRLDGPLSPELRRREQAQLDQLEQAIRDAEGRIGQLEGRAERVP